MVTKPSTSISASEHLGCLARAEGMDEMPGGCPLHGCHNSDNLTRGFSHVAFSLWGKGLLLPKVLDP